MNDMKSLVGEILRFHQLEEAFRDHDYFTLRVQPPRPNELEVRKVRGEIFVGEATNPDYWMIHQEMTYSPEMRFEVSESGVWTPIYLKEPHRPGRKSVEYVDGCRNVREVRHRNQVRYASSWVNRLVCRDYPYSSLRRVHFTNMDEG